MRPSQVRELWLRLDHENGISPLYTPAEPPDKPHDTQIPPFLTPPYPSVNTVKTRYRLSDEPSPDPIEESLPPFTYRRVESPIA